MSFSPFFPLDSPSPHQWPPKYPRLRTCAGIRPNVPHVSSHANLNRGWYSESRDCQKRDIFIGFRWVPWIPLGPDSSPRTMRRRRVRVGALVFLIAEFIILMSGRPGEKGENGGGGRGIKGEVGQPTDSWM
eukprot:171468-Amorphochlora_amoeboformis.AAC.1